MGLFSWLFGASGTHRIEGWHIDGITLSHPVRTPLGGRVRALGCVVDLDYRFDKNMLKVTRVRLGRSSLGKLTINVTATRRGEAWRADGSLQAFLERKILPDIIDELVEKDQRLQTAMRANAGIAPSATTKQKAFAHRLGIDFADGISKSDISALIEAKLSKKRR
jgi:hypothetical protein